jgi:hypothetical protein
MHCSWCGGYCNSTWWRMEDGYKMGHFCSRRCTDTASHGVGTILESPACFITTAICDILGKADDCDELQTLRQFRNTYMLSDTERRGLVDLYYETAPAIAKRMRENDDRHQEATSLYDEHIAPAVDAIKAGRDEEGMRIYSAMMARYGVTT